MQINGMYNFTPKELELIAAVEDDYNGVPTDVGKAIRNVIPLNPYSIISRFGRLLEMVFYRAPKA